MATWTNANRNGFFLNADQIGLTPDQRQALNAAGIDHPEECIEVTTKDQWKDVADIARCHTLMAGANAGGHAPLSVRNIHRLTVTSDLMNHYVKVGWTLAPNVCNYTNNAVRFSRQVQALRIKAKKDDKELTKCTQNMPVMKWVKHVKEDLNEIFTSDPQIPVPLGYVTRPTVNVGAISPLEPLEAFSTNYVSIQNELLHHYSHANPMWVDDNAKVFSLLDEATAGHSKLNSSINNQRRTRDGRQALLNIEAQHCDRAKWEELVRGAKRTIDTLVYNGSNPTFTLEHYTDKRRDAMNDWIDAEQCITTQVPLESELVTAYLEGVKSSNAEVRAAVAFIKNDTAGMASNFEDAASYIVPEFPVAKKLKNKTAGSRVSAIEASVSVAEAEPVVTYNDGVTMKLPIGKTGVYLGWISDPEVF